MTSLDRSACGSSGSSATKHREARAGNRAKQLRSARTARSGELPLESAQRKGLVFSCMAVVGHISTRFVVTEQNGAGHVNYEAR